MFIVLNHRSKKYLEKNGRRRVFSSQLHRLYRRAGASGNRLDARHSSSGGVWKSIFLRRRSCVPGLSNQHSRLCSGCFPVCSTDTWPRNFLLLLLLRALPSAGQTFTNLWNVCVLRILLFLLLSPLRISIFTVDSAFSPNFSPQNLTFRDDSSSRWPTDT